MNPALEVRITGGAGQGVFTNSPVVEGRKLALFGGRVIPCCKIDCVKTDRAS